MGYIYAGIGLLMVALVAGNIYFYQRSEIAVLEKEKAYKELSQALEVNQKNQKTISVLKKNAAETRAVTEKEIAASQSRDTAIEEIRKDMENVEGANAPAGSYWDAFSERLRGTKRSH